MSATQTSTTTNNINNNGGAPRVSPPETSFKARTGMGRFFAGEDASAVYEAAERLTGPVATPLVEHAGLTKSKNIMTTRRHPIQVLDMACGTGVVSAHLHQALKALGPEAQKNVQLTCADISESQIDHVRQRIQTQGWKNTIAVQTNAENTALPDNNFDVIMIGMALMLIPDPRSTVRECFRMLKPSGTFATSTWLVEGWVPDTRDAIAAANLPGNPPWPQSSDELVAAWAMGPWHSPAFVESMYRAAGYVDVKTDVVTRHIEMHDADDFNFIFRAFVRVVTDVYWTQKQREECLPLVPAAFKQFLESKYGVGKGFTVERTSIMASGRKP
ncbi:hypothetical protein N0V82_008701 [Gnomoniopsis sp. IMI 355080]|nr:hypothetical protein N0V82_008701 [Gnomoniopsis sp. IMI 355080]